MRLRLLEHERVATTRARRAAEQKLEQAERELDGLGFLADAAAETHSKPRSRPSATPFGQQISASSTSTTAGGRYAVLWRDSTVVPRRSASSRRRREQERGVEARAPGLEL